MAGRCPPYQHGRVSVRLREAQVAARTQAAGAVAATHATRIDSGRGAARRHCRSGASVRAVHKTFASGPAPRAALHGRRGREAYVWHAHVTAYRRASQARPPPAARVPCAQPGTPPPAAASTRSPCSLGTKSDPCDGVTRVILFAAMCIARQSQRAPSAPPLAPLSTLARASTFCFVFSWYTSTTLLPFSLNLASTWRTSPTWVE